MRIKIGIIGCGGIANQSAFARPQEPGPSGRGWRLSVISSPNALERLRPSTACLAQRPTTNPQRVPL